MQVIAPIGLAIHLNTKGFALIADESAQLRIALKQRKLPPRSCGAQNKMHASFG
jgi:hypothetical protein